MNTTRGARTGALYQGDRVLRRLSVVVDTQSFDVDQANGATRSALLAGLLLHDEIDMYRYSDDGAPPDAPLMELPWRSSRAPIGWLVARPEEPEAGPVSHQLEYCDGHQLSQAAIVTGQVDAIVSMLTVDSGAGAVTSEADAIALLAALEAGADMLVTTRPTLLRAAPTRSPGLTIASPDDALPIVGLYLRSRGEYIEAKSKDITFTTRKPRFFSSAVAFRIPCARRVMARSVLLDSTRGTDALGPLAAISTRRLGRSLERRDTIWRLLDQPQDADVAEDTLATLDSLLLFLMGAVDATARLTHQLLEIDTSPKRAGWQNDHWRSVISTRAPGLADVFAAGSREAAALTVLRELRNMIHAEGLDAVAVTNAGRIETTWIALPQLEGSTILTAAESTAPLTAWGLHNLGNGRSYAAPGALVDRLIAEVLHALARVSRELDTILSDETPLPPAAPKKSLFNRELIDQHLFWQLGLPD